jgi:hypothetical protein
MFVKSPLQKKTAVVALTTAAVVEVDVWPAQ